MINSAFSSGKSYSGGPIDYLLSKKDRSRDPELLRGDPHIIADLIDAIPRVWKYTSGVLRFHKDDKIKRSQIAGIMDSFEQFMFAGKARDSFDLMWVLHTDKNAVELHYLVPRVDLETGQDLNIAPPGYADQWSAWTEMINFDYGFVNPLTRSAKQKPKQEAPTRAEYRKQITQHMMDLCDNGEIKSRYDLINAFNKIGTVRSKNPNTKFISVKFDRFEKRFRFEGSIFAKDYDFLQKRPRHTSRASRTLSDYETHTDKSKATVRRFEQPPLDPCGDQGAYRRDIQERYDAAFAYREKRFADIRAKSKYLKQQQQIKHKPPTPDAPKERTHHVDWITRARQRVGNREQTLARVLRRTSQSVQGIRNALNRLRDRALEAIHNVTGYIEHLKAAREEKEISQYVAILQDHFPIAELNEKWAQFFSEVSATVDGQTSLSTQTSLKDATAKLNIKTTEMIAKIDLFIQENPSPFAQAARSRVLDNTADIQHSVKQDYPGIWATEIEKPKVQQYISNPSLGM